MAPQHSTKAVASTHQEVLVQDREQVIHLLVLAGLEVLVVREVLVQILTSKICSLLLVGQAHEEAEEVVVRSKRR